MNEAQRYIDYVTRITEEGELCSNGRVVKVFHEGALATVPESEVYTTAPDSRTETAATDATVYTPTRPTLVTVGHSHITGAGKTGAYKV